MPANILQLGDTAGQSSPIATAGYTGETRVADRHARYQEAIMRGSVFSLGVSTAAAITAYVGAAAGTPQVAIWNPAGSGVNAVIWLANFGNVVAASGAGSVNWGLWYGVTAAITQATTVAPVNQLSSAGGSKLTGFTAHALTASTALTNLVSLGSYYWATAAGAFQAPGLTFIDGAVVVPPGSMAALGGSAALTSATWVSSLVWEEVSIQS